MKYFRIFIFLLVSAVLFLFFNNCSKSTGFQVPNPVNEIIIKPPASEYTENNSDDGGANTNDIQTNESIASRCSDQEIAQLDTNLNAALEAVDTDVDFSLKLESEDGRVYTYERGTSTLETLYDSAATSKWVSATIILSYLGSQTNLNSAQPLSLNSTPQDFLPATEWPIPVQDSLRNITLRDLLSFTSGLKIDPSCLTIGLPTHSTIATCVKDVATANIGNGEIPGTKFDYSSSHLQVAGLMAIRAHEKATGLATTWNDLFVLFKNKTGLFPSATYNLPSENNPRLAGGMHWNGNEYHQFVKAFYKDQIYGASIVPGQSKTLRDLQLSNQVGTAAIGSSPALAGTNEDWRYGFGLWLECHVPTFNCSNNISTFSSAGAYGAYPFMNTKEKYYGVLARQGALGSFGKGFAIVDSVSSFIHKWATKTCQ